MTEPRRTDASTTAPDAVRHIGACLCGGVRFAIAGPLAPIQVCHCSQCRRAQGSAFAANIPLARAAFTLLAGAELLTDYEATPGKHRVFCGRCGAPVYSHRDGLPDTLRVRAGLLDPPVASRPAFQFHVASRADWWPLDVTLPAFDGPAPAAAAVPSGHGAAPPSGITSA